MAKLRCSEMNEEWRQLAVLPPLTRMIWPVMKEARVGGDEGDGLGDFFGPGAALERHRGVERGLLVRRAGQAIEHRGFGRPRRDGVDADAESGGFECCGFGQALDGMLARDIERRDSQRRARPWWTRY